MPTAVFKHSLPDSGGPETSATGEHHETNGRAVHRKRVDFVATDSEWDRGLPDPWLSTTFASREGIVVCIRPVLLPELRRRLNAEARRLRVKLVYVRRTDATDLLDLAGVAADRGDVRLAFFYSPKDVEYALGWDRLREAISGGRVRQRYALAGRVGRVVLRDLSGWAGKESLRKFAAAMGVRMPGKTTMDEYKSRMSRGLTECPEEYLRYAVEDARALLRLYRKFVKFVRHVQRDMLVMPNDALWNVRTVPITQGRLVAETFRRWLVARAGADVAAVRFADRKLGLLDPDAKGYAADREVRHDLVSRVRSPKDLESLAADQEGRAVLKEYHRAEYHHTAVGGAGVRWFAGRPLTETAGFNALVHGGRCCNERPDECALGPGLDVDIRGCYGTSLRELTYPVGLPSVWSWGPNDTRPTLGEWLDAHEADLLPGLWTATVSGRLPFEQDLLYSKLVKHRDIRKAAADGDGADIPSDFVLLRREVKNAVLTADLLETLRAVATDKEWRSLKRLEVVTAAAYRKSDRAAGPRAWARAVMAWKDPGRAVRLSSGQAADERPRVWYGVHLEPFVGRLADERERAKVGGRPGLDKVLKLMVNTLYGVFSSRHFPVGNTVLANNITARGRLGVWMVAKALGLRQTITDGGVYDPFAVPHVRGKRPGLDTLSRPAAWADPRHSRTFARLPGLEWEPGQPVPAGADAAARAHVRAFWRAYGLRFRFDLTHKGGFVRAAYMMKADYALLPGPGAEPDIKLRGKHRSKRTDRKPHPSYALQESVLAGGDEFPDDLTYTRGGLMTVEQYRAVQASTTGYDGLKDLRPGDDLPPTEHVAVYNNLHFPIPDERTFLRRRNRKRFHRGRPVEFFEWFRALGVRAVIRAMGKDRLTKKGPALLRTTGAPNPG